MGEPAKNSVEIRQEVEYHWIRVYGLAKVATMTLVRYEAGGANEDRLGLSIYTATR